MKSFTPDGTGPPFDPLSEDGAVTVRDQGGVVHSAVIPAGSPGWRGRPAAGPVKKYLYTDRAGSFGHVTKIALRSPTTPGFGGRFRADVKIQNAALASASNTDALTVNLRVGNDCWEQRLPCAFNRRGSSASCQKPSAQQSCPVL
jgi:hypothetical protein